MSTIDIPASIQPFHFPDYPLKQLTTFGTGGIGKFVFFPRSIESLIDIVCWGRSIEMSPYLLGHGSNCLIPDGDVHRPICCTKHIDAITIEKNMLTAECGASLPVMARQSAKAGLSGLEFAIDIPGVCGASVMGNAGAYGSEMFETLTDIEILNEDGKRQWLKASELEPSYRNSNIGPNRVVLQGKFSLQPDAVDIIQARIAKNQAHRLSAQPKIKGAAGSIFKNPEGHQAWQLIESVGLKGYSIGGASVSELHGNWIVNQGSASSKDVRDLIFHVQSTVKSKTGVALAAEVRIFPLS